MSSRFTHLLSLVLSRFLLPTCLTSRSLSYSTEGRRDDRVRSEGGQAAQSVRGECGEGRAHASSPRSSPPLHLSARRISRESCVHIVSPRSIDLIPCRPEASVAKWCGEAGEADEGRAGIGGDCGKAGVETTTPPPDRCSHLWPGTTARFERTARTTGEAPCPPGPLVCIRDWEGREMREGGSGALDLVGRRSRPPDPTTTLTYHPSHSTDRI